MSQTTANGVTLEYETYGEKSNPALLLVMGLGAQLTLWPIELVEALVARGFYVIRHDNRDIGLSAKFTEAGVPDIGGVVMALMSGSSPKFPIPCPTWRQMPWRCSMPRELRKRISSAHRWAG